MAWEVLSTVGSRPTYSRVHRQLYVGSFISNKVNTPYWVTQGSVLGLLLFLLWINISKCSDKLKFYLFADDTSFLYPNRDCKSLENTINTELF